MERVTGIGGVFFRSRNPKALSDWYRDHLGVDPVPSGAESLPWMTEAGATVFAPFADETDYFPAGKAFMINFRVRDLDAMLVQLRRAGIEISREETMDGIGRFARIHDPEGNAIELWEPAG